MTIRDAELAGLIREIEIEDPIDYADLPYDEDALRLLVCGQMREIADQAGVLDEESRQMVYLAVAAKLVLENMVLHLRLLKAQGLADEESADTVFRRLRARRG
jgi:hypothetical protein